LIDALEKELIVLANKARYIQENLDGTIDLRKKKREEVSELLKSKDYDILDKDNDYKYLTKMPMDSVTEENVDKLNRDHENKVTELENVKNTTINQMWINELEAFKEEYLEYKETRERIMNGLDGSEKSGASKTKKKVISKGPLKPKSELVVV
jgi:DNA topoisomerase-2